MLIKAAPRRHTQFQDAKVHRRHADVTASAVACDFPRSAHELNRSRSVR